VVVVCEPDENERVVVVCERLVLDWCPLGASDAVLLVLVALVGFDDDEVDGEVDDRKVDGGKVEVELRWLNAFGSGEIPLLELGWLAVFATCGWPVLVDACPPGFDDRSTSGLEGAAD